LAILIFQFGVLSYLYMQFNNVHSRKLSSLTFSSSFLQLYFFWITHIKERKIKMQDISKKVMPKLAPLFAISISLILIASAVALADIPIDILTLRGRI